MSTRRRWLRWTMAGLTVSMLAVIAASWFLAGGLVASTNHPVRIPDDFGKTVSITRAGHDIAATWVDKGGNTPVVLLLHGLRGDRASMLARARLMDEAGFSVLLIDQQAHGETSGERITLGWLESMDVRDALGWLRAQAPGRRVGVIGVSLGGASVLLGPQPAGFDAVVVEATYPRVRRAIENRIGIRLGGLDKLLAPLLIVQIEPRLHVSPDQLEPIRAIGSVGAPILVVGGRLDAHTTEEETRELFAAAREPKELWIVERAVHEDFSRVDPAGYREHVVGFLRRHLEPAH